MLAYPVNGRTILEEVGATLRARGLNVEEISVERGRLDEVFRQITARA
jgi:ABC-2 type transport system ATP-binding protein